MPTMNINGNLADVSSSTATFLNTLDLIVKKKRRRYANKTKVKWAFQVWCVYNKAVRIRTNLRIQVVSKAINNIRSCHAKLKAIALKQWQQVKNFDRLKKVYAEMQESKQLANVMKATRQEVRELINVDQVLMYLYDEDSGYLFAQLSDGTNPVLVQKGKGIVGKVAETLKPLRINDVATSSEYNGLAGKTLWSMILI